MDTRSQPRNLLFVMFLLTLSACAQTGPTVAPAVTGRPPDVVTPTVDESEGRYFNEQGQFSLSLPEGWRVFGPVDASAGEGVSFKLYSLGLQPEASGGPGASSIVIMDPGAVSIERFVQAQCSTCPAAPIQDIQLGDVSARQTVIGGGGVPIEVTWTFFDHNGMRIGLKIHDAETLEPLQQVLESLQLH